MILSHSRNFNDSSKIQRLTEAGNAKSNQIINMIEVGCQLAVLVISYAKCLAIRVCEVINWLFKSISFLKVPS